ncbi:hypothetical protein GYMLUDRAFT_53779 [Collybiopsis luxurians FD-317 M1]|nr:hypothetical protein GYMLUDRAFT_53779 [Collybiopsis luxurians FD-317 M1]
MSVHFPRFPHSPSAIDLTGSPIPAGRTLFARRWGKEAQRQLILHMLSKGKDQLGKAVETLVTSGVDDQEMTKLLDDRDKLAEGLQLSQEVASTSKTSNKALSQLKNIVEEQFNQVSDYHRRVRVDHVRRHITRQYTEEDTGSTFQWKIGRSPSRKRDEPTDQNSNH